MFAVHAAEDVVLGRPLHVVAHQQVQEAVAVEIEPQGGGAEGAPGAQSGLGRDVQEMPAAGVLEEAILPYSGDQNVRETIVVVVRNRHAHAVHFDCQPGALGDVREDAVAIVPVEPRGAALALVARPIGAIHDQDVEPPIAVIIEERAPRPQSLGQVLLAERAAVVVKGEPRRASHVHQSKPRVGGGGEARASGRPQEERSTGHADCPPGCREEIGWQAKAPAPRRRKSCTNAGQALPPANPRISAILSRLPCPPAPGPWIVTRCSPGPCVSRTPPSPPYYESPASA